MKLDRREFFKKIAAGAVAVALPTVAVATDSIPEVKHNIAESKSLGSATVTYYVGYSTEKEQLYKIDGPFVCEGTYNGKWNWNTLEHQKMCPEIMSDTCIEDFIIDLEYNIKG